MNNQDYGVVTSHQGAANQASNTSTSPRDNKTDSTHRLSKNMSQNHNEQGYNNNNNIQPSLGGTQTDFMSKRRNTA